MTYKHTKFQDSPIMRSFERVAQEKGLVKPEVLTKTAANKKTDLTPTGSLLDNVLKLCAGLRDRGFEKQANELEVHLVNYKRAQTLYETSTEKGEDLVHAAHPKGSHKLEGVDAEEAVFEDILDQMAKTLQVVEKKPTGKLGCKEGIQAVMVALGAGPLDLKKVGGASLVFTKLMNLIKGVPELNFPASTAPAVEGAEAAGAVGTTGLVAAGVAALAAAIVGGEIGSALFERYYSPTDLQEAGKRLQSELNDVASSLNPQESNYVESFNDIFLQIIKTGDIIGQTKNNPSPTNLEKLNEYNNLLYQARHVVGNIWSVAQSHKDQQFLGALRGFGDVVAAASNFLTVVQRKNAAIEQFFTEAVQAVAKNSPSKTQSVSDAAQQLIQNFDNALQNIDLYKARIVARALPNATALTGWLDNNASKFGKQWRDDFANSKFNSDPDILASYTNKYNTLKSKLDAFQQKWLT